MSSGTDTAPSLVSKVDGSDTSELESVGVSEGASISSEDVPVDSGATTLPASVPESEVVALVSEVSKDISEPV